MIRYSCEVLPGCPGDVPFAYLQAFLASGRRVRAQAIGAAVYACEERWWNVSEAFLQPLTSRFVNVVCSPFLRRVPSPARQAFLERVGAGVNTQHVVPPATAFGALFTEGGAVANVAIVVPQSSLVPAGTEPPTRTSTRAEYELETAALARYDRVIVWTADRQPAMAELLRDTVGGDPARVQHVPAQADALEALMADGGW